MHADDETVRRFVAELNGHPNDANDAQAELALLGDAALDPLLAAAPSFDRFGQLCAIELLQEIGDPRSAAVLIPMLESQEDTVREWAAIALGDMGVVGAVPGIRRAYDEVKRRGTPLDYTEPTSLRRALTKLGGRAEVVPAVVAALSLSEENLERGWKARDLEKVISALADAGQLILSCSLWARSRAGLRWIDTPAWELDWSLPWAALVESASAGALQVARSVEVPKGAVATLSWMDELDR